MNKSTSQKAKRASKLPSFLASRRPHKEAGFTLAELLVTIFLTSIIMAAIYSVYRVQTHSVKVQEKRLEAQEYARVVMDLMVREIRNAGYAPTGAACAGIATAAAQTLRFLYDADANGNCSGANEDITYAFSTSGCPAGFGNITRNGEPVTDCNVPVISGTPQFQFIYYPQQTGSSPPNPYCYVTAGDVPGCGSQIVTANLGNVQRVWITLTVRSKNTDAQFGGELNATITSNADLRNRGLPS